MKIGLDTSRFELLAKENPEYREKYLEKIKSIKKDWKRIEDAIITRASSLLPYKDFTDTRIEVLATKIGGPDENDFGVICRFQDINNFYSFSISSDGYWGIFKSVNGEWELIGKEFLQFNEYINQGQATNKIQAECIGDMLALYVNGEYLFEVEDDSFSSVTFQVAEYLYLSLK